MLMNNVHKLIIFFFTVVLGGLAIKSMFEQHYHGAFIEYDGVKAIVASTLSLLLSLFFLINSIKTFFKYINDRMWPLFIFLSYSVEFVVAYLNFFSL